MFKNRALGLLVLLTLLITAPTVSAKILISQIQVSGETTTDEFVELYNTSSTPETLSAFNLKKQTNSGALYPLVSSFPENILINPFSYFLISHQNYQPIGSVNSDIFYSNSANSLADNNALYLSNDSGEIVDSVFWGTISSTLGEPNANPSKNQALVRLENNIFTIAPSNPHNSSFLVSTATITEITATDAVSTTASSTDDGESTASTTTSTDSSAIQNTNSASTDSTEMSNNLNDSASANNTTNNFDYTKLKINEFLPAPESGAEWVELYNTGLDPTNLTGIFICDAVSATSSCKISSSTINPQEFLKIDLGTNRYLNNSGDTIRLLDPNGNLLDEIIYQDSLVPDKNQSLARLEDGQDTDSLSNWAITTLPTPGSANIINRPIALNSPVTSGATGLSAGSNQSLPINNTFPTPTTTTDTVRLSLKINAPQFAAPNELLTFSALGSADPRGGKINYSWNFGDGYVGASQEAIHAFNTSGDFVVTLIGHSSAGTLGSKTIKIKISSEFFVASGTIKFSEVLTNPDGDETAEFIELANTSDTPISVSGWRLINNKKTFTIPERTKIPPHSWAIFYRAITKITLANTKSQTMILQNQAGTIIDQIVVPKITDENTSYARFNDSWELTNQPTPGEFNISGILTPAVEINTGTPVVTDIKISAVKKNVPPLATTPTNPYTSLTGVISTPSGIFGKRFAHIITNKNQGWLLQLPAKWNRPLKAGEVIKTSGQIKTTSAGKTYLNITALSKLEAPATTLLISAKSLSSTPAVFSIDEIEDELAGALISVNGEITQKKGSVIYIDDDSGEQLVVFKTGAHITKTRFNIGDRVNIVGVLVKNSGHLELWPRADSDIQVVSRATLAPKPPPTNAPRSEAAAYGVTTLGGAGLLALAQRLKRVGKLAKLFSSSS
ncbi:MAG: lamin tail domain-containing protein [Candidatus Magasanikbacteria bacterium]|nr:lamin tail domain-containing protein [Candidatus Magasanikbacteria bacterium]